MKDSHGINQFCIPHKYPPDSLTNKEIGWKTEFFDHRLQMNGAVYQETGTTCRSASSTPGRQAT